jgi:hypothetical protein
MKIPAKRLSAAKTEYPQRRARNRIEKVEKEKGRKKGAFPEVSQRIIHIKQCAIWYFCLRSKLRQRWN